MANFPSDSVRTKNWGTEILTDADLEGQLDLLHDYIKALLNSSTGHNHDGTSNQSQKISGLSIQSLNLLPSGAGVIPSANLPSPISVNNVVYDLSDGATPALDASLGTVFTLSAAGDRTIAVPTNPVSGQKITIRHYASGGARTLALNTGAGGFRYGTDITQLTQTTSGKYDYIGCIYNSTDSKWDVVSYIKGF